MLRVVSSDSSLSVRAEGFQRVRPGWLDDEGIPDGVVLCPTLGLAGFRHFSLLFH